MNTRKGFTLVELLVVIAILAILATVSVVGYTSFIDRAHQSNAQTEADQIKSIVSNALMIDDYVILNDGTTTIYVTKNGATATQPTSATETLTYVDATADVKELGGKISLDGTTLKYTNHGYVVDVMNRVATKAPATGE